MQQALTICLAGVKINYIPSWMLTDDTQLGLILKK